MRIERVSARRSRAGNRRKPIGQGELSRLRRFVGLLVHKRRLIGHRLQRHGGSEGAVLADREVHAVAGPQHGLPGQPQRHPQPRRQRQMKRIDQRTGQIAAKRGRRTAGLHFRQLGKACRRIGVHQSQAPILLRVRREELIAQAVGQRQAGARAPVVLRVEVPHVVAQIAFGGRRVDGCLLRQPQQKIRQRRAGGGILRLVLGEFAAEREASGRVRAAQKVAMHAAIVAAEAQVVLAVDPAQRLGERDGLREREARLLFAQAGDRSQLDAGQTVVDGERVERPAARPQNAEFCGDVRPVGKEVRPLAGAAIPTGVEDVGYLAITHRVSGLHTVRVRRTLAAQLRKHVHVVRGRVAPVVVEVDALPQTLILIPAPAAPAESTAPSAAGQRGVLAQAAHIAHAGLRRVRLRGGQQVIVVAIGRGAASEVRLGVILQQRRGLRCYARCGNHVRRAVVDELLQGRGVVDRRQAGSGKIAAPLGIRGHGGVFVQRTGIALAGERQEEHVLAARLGQMRQVRRAHEGDSEAVGSRGRLLLRLAGDAERLRIERRVGAHPEDGPVRLAGVEAAEAAAAAPAAAATKTAPAEAATAKASAAQPAAKQAAAVYAGQAALGANRLDRIADAVHIDAGQRAHLSRLAADGHRISAEVRVARDGGQLRSRRAIRAGRNGWAGLGLRIGCQRAHQAQVLRAVGRQLANGLRLRTLEGLLPRLLLSLLRRPRSQHQLKIHCLVAAGGVQHRLLRSGRKARKLRADHVAAILRNLQGPGAGNVSRGGEALAGERILGSHSHAWQGSAAALHHAVQHAAGRRRRLLDLTGRGRRGSGGQTRIWGGRRSGRRSLRPGRKAASRNHRHPNRPHARSPHSRSQPLRARTLSDDSRAALVYRCRLRRPASRTIASLWNAAPAAPQVCACGVLPASNNSSKHLIVEVFP